MWIKSCYSLKTVPLGVLSEQHKNNMRLNSLSLRLMNCGFYRTFPEGKCVAVSVSENDEVVKVGVKWE